jgi:hypothetical protein
MELQPIPSEGKEYTKVPLEEYERDETEPEEKSPNDQAVITTEVQDEQGSDDKQTLLVYGEAGETPTKEFPLPWRTLISIYFIVWTESAVMNGFNPIIPGNTTKNTCTQ